MHTEVMSFKTKEARNVAFDDLRANGDVFEKQAVRFSEPEVTGKLDDRGRIAYATTWYLAHPRN